MTCSGIGRSGVFVAADVVLRKLRALAPEDTSGARKAVNLKDLVIELRRCALPCAGVLCESFLCVISLPVCTAASC